MILEILKNPIVLGLFAGTIVYLYLLWSNEKKNKTKNKIKNKKDINPMIPLIVSVVVCIISYASFYSSCDLKKTSAIDLTETLNVKNIGNKIKFAFSDGDDNLKHSSESVTEFHLMKSGLHVPNKAIPEVFMETFS